MNQKIKILNLYAGIGGNRKLWPSDKIDVTAIELNPDIAKIYQDFFPDDKVIVADAHQYLLEHYKDFDFIWASPPCQSHSVTNWFLHSQNVIRYPDMSLYQEIIFLKNFAKKKPKWVIENVKSYYEPLIYAYVVDRHYVWSNFFVSNKDVSFHIGRMNGANQDRIHSKRICDAPFDLSNYKIKNKEGIVNNCVNPKLGLHIFNEAFKMKHTTVGDFTPNGVAEYSHNEN